MADDKNLLGEKFTVTSLLESKPVLETYDIFSNIVSDLKVVAVLINFTEALKNSIYLKTSEPVNKNQNKSSLDTKIGHVTRQV